MRNSVSARRIDDEAGRCAVVNVLRATYQDEKQWIADPESQFPPADLTRGDISWFLVLVSTASRAACCACSTILHWPSMQNTASSRSTARSTSRASSGSTGSPRSAASPCCPRIAASMVLAAALMRAVTAEVVARGYTHFVTDVFEDDVHSPYGFHTRVMGFRPVATHDFGELQLPQPPHHHGARPARRLSAPEGARQLDVPLSHLRMGRAVAPAACRIGPHPLVPATRLRTRLRRVGASVRRSFSEGGKRGPRAKSSASRRNWIPACAGMSG